jgi:hypothetical protein
VPVAAREGDVEAAFGMGFLHVVGSVGESCSRPRQAERPVGPARLAMAVVSVCFPRVV